MEVKAKRNSALMGVGLVALLAALLVFIGFQGVRTDPPDPIGQTDAQLEVPAMYVAPGATGTNNGGEGDNPDSNSESGQESEQESEQPDAAVNPLQTVAANTGTVVAGDSGGNTSGGSGGQGSGSGSSGQGGTNTGQGGQVTPSTPNSSNDSPNQQGGNSGDVLPNINTNLGDYTNINANTPAPDAVSFTYGGRSGLNRDDRCLYFYAIPSDNSSGYSVLVEYSNASTGGATVALEGDNGIFALPVELSDGAVTNVTITLVTPSGGRTGTSLDYTVTYEGRQGPTIEISIAEGGETSDVSPYTFTVKATDADGAEIWDSGLEVTVTGPDGETRAMTPASSSGSTYEYDIDFNSFILTGDDNSFTVTVKATDSSIEKASSTLTRSVTYSHHSYGEVVGQARITIDATPVGLAYPVADFYIDLHQGFPFAQDLCEGLEAQGIRPVYSGSYDNNFYLSGLSSGGLFAGQAIPDTLMHKIDQDKITYTGSHSDDSLSDQDWTGNSGWLYCVNDSVWPSRNLGSFTAVNGDWVELVFTIGYGKDVGNPSGGGALSSYCGTWRHGVYTPQHNLSVYTEVVAPTCGSEGQACYVCDVEGCGTFGDQEGATDGNGQYITVPATGEHSWVFDAMNSEEPTEDQDGYRHYVCSVCGATYDEVWPWEGDSDTPDEGGA